MKNLLAILFLLIASPVWATIAHVQDAGQVIVGTSPSAALGTVTVGNLITVCIHSGSSVTNVSDTQSNVYTGPVNGLNGWWLYYVKNAKAGATTVNVTCSGGAAFCGFLASEFSGFGTLPINDGNAANTTYTTGQTLITTSSLSSSGINPELVLTCGLTDSVQTPTVSGTQTGFTNQAQTASSGGETIVGGYQVVSTSGPFSGQWTVTSSPTFGMTAIFLTGPIETWQSRCPQGKGVTGICDYPPTVVGNAALQVCPASTGPCDSVFTDATVTCGAGLSYLGGGANICPVVWNGSAYVGF